MSMTIMSRMCESIENVTPTRKKEIISATLSSLSTKDRIAMVKLLAMEYDSNNIGEKKAIKWLANIYNVFEDEIEEEAEKWLDLGEGMLQYLYYDKEHLDMSLQQMIALLELDCSSMKSDAYSEISRNITSMSNLQIKWFIRYWLRTPRNGINTSMVEKSMSLLYDKDISKFSKTNSLSSMVMYLDNDKDPPEHTHGAYIKPMLAKSYTGKLPDRFIIDTKYDGNRYQIHKADDIIVFNRKGKVVTDQYPDVVSWVSEFDVNKFVIDCEIFPIDEVGNPTAHQKLGTRVHSKDKQKAVSDCPVQLVVFDCMSYMGNAQLNQPYDVRLEVMKKFVPEEYQARMFEHGNIEAAYNVAINGGFEGIMIKDLDATYESKRSKALLKHKPPRIELDVVITSGKHGSGKRAGVVATYGVSVKEEGAGYVEVGSVGSGISEVEMDALSVKLKRIVESYDNGTYFFLPRIVLEITSDAVTKNQDGTYGLRFPRIIRIREDKYPSDCNTIQDIERYCSNI